MDPLHFSSPADIDEFVAHLEKFERGEISADEFKVFRLGRGVYGQRQADVQMIRVKIPQGVLTDKGCEVVADVAEKHSRGFCHVTTRQNIQLHHVKLADAEAAMRLLDEAGLTTKEACGNTVRNVTGCALAGVCSGAPFDVTPYGQAVTRHFLRNPFCQALPRKFKMAFSGCETDCAQGAINDVGCIARVKDGVRGFRVIVGGGLSTTPENAHVLEEFVPAERLLATIEAVVRVFDRTGNRENKSRARLKYVLRKLKLEGFRAEYEKELAQIAAQGRLEQPIDASHEVRPDAVLRLSPPAPRSEAAPEPGFAEFRRTNCLPQRQSGYHAVLVRLVRGDITAAQLRGVARLARQFSDGTVRLTNEQNVLFRFIHEDSLSALHAELVRLELALPGARSVEDVTACPGADTCNLAVTRSRELASAVSDRLAGLPLDDVRDVDVKISGCPNSCGQHHVAVFGFHGTMRRVEGQTVPEYQLHLGGGIDGQSGATFGRHVVKLPARRVPEAVARLVELYRKERQEGEKAPAFFRRVDAALVKQALSDLTTFDPTTAKPEEWLDHGDDTPFKVAIGQGECAA
jgi:sulfite reductase beta subunit-like hemoprotein